MSKKIEKAFLMAIAVAVLCAGTVSARQLQKKPNLLPTCTGTCSAKKPCSGVCICQIFSGTTGACVKEPGPVRPPAK